jgi:D-arabinose 1-dehydrogenase-like Zn-dependent alcohol dehydrogenase
VGTEKQLEELLEQAVAGKIVPAIEVLEFDRISDVMQRLQSGAITGRVVIKIVD